MKQTFEMRVIILVVTILTSVMFLSRCTSSDDKVQQADEEVEQAERDLQEAEARYAEELAAFKQNASEQIAENDKKLAELKLELAKDKKQVKDDYDARIAALELKNAEMKMRMDSSGHIAGHKWTSFKEEFNHDMNELGKSLSDFSKDNE